jgi:hypothetical protein
MFPALHVNEFLKRSSCSITSLGFSKITISPVDLMALLRSMPDLSELTLDERPDAPSLISDNFLEELQGHLSMSFRSSCHIFLPLLRMMVLRVSGQDFSDFVFTEMVKSRSLHCETDVMARLTKIDLHVHDRRISSASVEQLREVSGEAVRISLADESGPIFFSEVQSSSI